MNVKEEAKEEQERRENVLFAAIRKHFANFGYMEIVEAFELAVVGKLEVDLYQKLDGVLFSRVMTAYTKKFNRADIIRQYKPKLKQPEMSKEQNESENRKAYLENYNGFIIPEYQKFKEKKGLEYEPFYNDYREWFGCDAMRYLQLFDLDEDTKKTCWSLSEKKAFELEKLRVQAAQGKGDLMTKITEQDTQAKRKIVYKHLCFWEQLKSWKIEEKELETIK